MNRHERRAADAQARAADEVESLMNQFLRVASGHRSVDVGEALVSALINLMAAQVPNHTTARDLVDILCADLKKSVADREAWRARAAAMRKCSRFVQGGTA
jgi:hypothetical protein